MYSFLKNCVCLAVLGLCCCTRVFSRCGKWGLFFAEVPGLIAAVTSPVAGYRL